MRAPWRRALTAFASIVIAAAVSFVAGCRPAPAVAPEGAAPLRGWHYRVGIEPDLTVLHVQVCFQGRAPSRMISGDGFGSRFIANPRSLRDGHRLRRRGKYLYLDNVPEDGCIAYDAQLAAMADRDGRRKARRVGDNILAKPSMWLWRPTRRPADPEVSLRFELPDGVKVSAPWQVKSGQTRTGKSPTFILDPTTWRWLGYVAFGDLYVDRFAVGKSEIEVVVLDEGISATPEGIRGWVIDAARNLAALYDGVPRDRMQIVVLPVEGGGGGPVYFGMATRGGGAGVYLLLDTLATDEELPGGWTTTHEFLHHGMPFVDDAWMGEGFVSYYTEIMRTRAGHRDEADGWRKLHGAFNRGKRGGRGISLQRTSDRMGTLFAFQRVYWGGGAIAFLLDVAVREDSGGKVTLDDAMRYLRRCCGDATHRWDARKLLHRLDRWYGKPLFSEIGIKHLESSRFPPVDEAFQKLGVIIDGDDVTLDDSSPMAEIRRSMMAPRPRP